MKRREAREKAVQTLFQLDNTETTLPEAIEHVMGEETDSFYESLVEGTVKHLSEIDELLKQKLENWQLDRLPKIERTILRLSVFELAFLNDAPKNVVMNEAIELSKLFGEDSSSKFVNGVLSKFSEQ